MEFFCSPGFMGRDPVILGEGFLWIPGKIVAVFLECPNPGWMCLEQPGIMGSSLASLPTQPFHDGSMGSGIFPKSGKSQE